MRTQGIVIKFPYSLKNQLPSFTKNNTCLLLPDSIEDPQNLGQIIRMLLLKKYKKGFQSILILGKVICYLLEGLE